MGLGLEALGRPGYINLGHASDLEKDYSIEGMQLRAHSVLDEAWELGVRYFDAARSYGLAESFWGPGCSRDLLMEQRWVRNGGIATRRIGESLPRSMKSKNTHSRC